MLAALRDRVMLPDGTLVPWRSPAGDAAADRRRGAGDPVDATSSTPRRRTAACSRTRSRRARWRHRPVGVEKATVVNAIFAAAQFATGPGQPVGEPFVPGRPMGFLAPPGLDPEADVTEWVTRTDAGEPYDDAAGAGDRRDARATTTPPTTCRRPAARRRCSSPPASPTTCSRSTRSCASPTAPRKRWPGLPLSLLLGDFGHQRASNEPRERDRLLRSIHGWFDHHLRDRGDGRPPRRGVTAFAQTCPQRRRVDRPVSGTELRPPVARRAAAAGARSADDQLAGRRPGDRRRARPGRRRRRRLRRGRRVAGARHGARQPGGLAATRARP